MRPRRLLTAPALLLAVLPGWGDVDDRVERLAHAVSVPGWATGVAVLPRPDARRDLRSVHTSIDLADCATGPDLAAFVARMPGLAVEAGLGERTDFRRLHFDAASGARLSIVWRGAVDATGVGRGTSAWLARASTDGSAHAVLGTDGELTFADQPVARG